MLLDEIAMALNDEMIRAKEKFPWWPDDIIHGASIVAEEAGELVKASLQNFYEKGSLEDVKKEAIQTATMAIRFLQNLSI